jgi:hypothetical protein
VLTVLIQTLWRWLLPSASGTDRPCVDALLLRPAIAAAVGGNPPLLARLQVPMPRPPCLQGST